MFTKGGAAATGEENKKRLIAKGMFADFVVIAEDPTAIPANKIHAINIQQTWVAGKLAYAGDNKK